MTTFGDGTDALTQNKSELEMDSLKGQRLQCKVVGSLSQFGVADFCFALVDG